MKIPKNIPYRNLFHVTVNELAKYLTPVQVDFLVKHAMQFYGKCVKDGKSKHESARLICLALCNITYSILCLQHTYDFLRGKNPLNKCLDDMVLLGDTITKSSMDIRNGMIGLYQDPLQLNQKDQKIVNDFMNLIIENMFPKYKGDLEVDDDDIDDMFEDYQPPEDNWE